MIRLVCQELQSTHVEADTRILQHIKYVHCQNTEIDLNVVVRTDDTCVLVILLYHASRYGNLQLYMEIGHSANNTR